MRIQYTIPGIEYGGPAEPLDFPSSVPDASRPQTVTWRDVLGLNTPQPGDLVLPAPPKPATLSYTDAAETRRLWLGLLDRHSAAQPAGQAEARMLETLAWLRRQEDDLQAAILADPKE